jgi:hypothetical protein
MISRRMIFPLALLMLAACRDESAPYLEFAGGGFVFNYRVADDFYGFVAQVKKPLPAGGTVEAQFEVPQGPAEIVTQDVTEGQFQYMFRSSNLRGIVKDHPYKATLLVRDAKGAEVARYEKTFQTDVDQSTLPTDPLVVGPGYQKAPGSGG